MSTVNRLDIFATHTHTTPCRTSIYAESSQSLYSNLLRLSPYHITSKAGGHSLPPHNSRRACSRLYSSPPLLVTVVCLCCGRDSRLSITAARAKEEEEQQQQHLSVAQCYNSYCWWCQCPNLFMWIIAGQRVGQDIHTRQVPQWRREKWLNRTTLAISVHRQPGRESQLEYEDKRGKMRMGDYMYSRKETAYLCWCVSIVSDDWPRVIKQFWKPRASLPGFILPIFSVFLSQRMYTTKYKTDFIIHTQHIALTYIVVVSMRLYCIFKMGRIEFLLFAFSPQPSLDRYFLWTFVCRADRHSPRLDK